jgi:hypothetical protein
MTVARARKKKLNKDESYVRDATYLHMAIMAINLCTVFDMTKEQFKEVAQGHAALIEEAADGRNDVDGLVRDAFFLTGINIKPIVDNAFDGRKG